MTETPRPLIAGNWKMNGLRADGLALAAAIAARARAAAAETGPEPALACDLLVCPPATLIWQVVQAVADSGVAVGGQDCHAAESGAHSGDVSASMLADSGCAYTITGHSERRADHAETDSLVRAKAMAARAAGLVPIVCVGETEAERDAGDAVAVVARQLAGSVPEAIGGADLVIAYEPVWAIGTGRTPSPEDVAEIHAHIRGYLRENCAEADRIRILYGGSVKPDSAAALLAVANVDGALVGGASLDADGFWAIARACPSQDSG